MYPGEEKNLAPFLLEMYASAWGTEHFHGSLSGCMAEVTLASETLRCRVSMAHPEKTVTAMPTTIIKVLFLC
jgi:hypothetical protein